MGYFRDVQVVLRQTDQGKIVTYVVAENPIIRSINYAGNRHVKKDKLDEILTIKSNQTLDFKKLYENQQRIQSYYSQSGYYLASVKYSLLQVDENSVAVTFDVTEGNKLKLKSIDFVGNERFDDGDLKGVMKTKEWDLLSPIMSRINNRGIYQEPVFFEDLQKVTEYYMDRGYLRAHVGDPEVTHDKKSLFVKVEVGEGDPYTVEKLDVRGDEFLDTAEARKKFRVKSGDIFNRRLMTEDIDALTDKYSNRGFFYANVTPLTGLDDQKKTVDITYDVEKGRLVYFEDIDVVGNTKTRDDVIRRQLAVSEGELYNAGAVKFSKNRVKALGYFEDVTVNTRVGSTENQLDLTVGVKERPTGSFSFGAGFSSVDQFIFAAQIQQQNLFGRGQQIALSADLGGRRSTASFRWADPYVMGSNWATRVDAFVDDREFNDFTREGKGAGLSVGYPVFDNTRLFAGYDFESQQVSELGFDATALLIREDVRGGSDTGTFTTSLIRDTRDDRIDPRRGTLFSIGLEAAGGGVGDNEFTKVEGRATWWFPFKLFPWESTIAVNLRAGGAEARNTLEDFDLNESVTRLGTQPAPGFSPPVCCAGTQETTPVPSNVAFKEGDSAQPGHTFPLSVLDSDQLLPITERFFLGGLNSVRGYKARSLGPRRATMQRVLLSDVAAGGFGAGSGGGIPNGTIRSAETSTPSSIWSTSSRSTRRWGSAACSSSTGARPSPRGIRSASMTCARARARGCAGDLPSARSASSGGFPSNARRARTRPSSSSAWEVRFRPESSTLQTTVCEAFVRTEGSQKDARQKPDPCFWPLAGSVADGPAGACRGPQGRLRGHGKGVHILRRGQDGQVHVHPQAGGSHAPDRGPRGGTQQDEGRSREIRSDAHDRAPEGQGGSLPAEVPRVSTAGKGLAGGSTPRGLGAYQQDRIDPSPGGREGRAQPGLHPGPGEEIGPLRRRADRDHRSGGRGDEQASEPGDLFRQVAKRT
jgi:outer membrane protein insertion porin family